MVWKCFSMVWERFPVESFDFPSFSLCFISLLGGGPDPDILVDLLDPPVGSLIFYIGAVILLRNPSTSF